MAKDKDATQRPIHLRHGRAGLDEHSAIGGRKGGGLCAELGGRLRGNFVDG